MQIQNLNIQLEEYLSEKNANGSIDYVCKDQYGDYYLFRQTSIGDYKLVLDRYTLRMKNLKKNIQKQQSK